MNAHREIKENEQQPANAMTPAVKQFCYQFPEEVNDHDMTATLPTELTSTSGTHLDHLNEDCLVEIFSQNSLTLMDLSSLAETCKLFKRIARRVFPKSLYIYKHHPELSEYVIASLKNLKNFNRRTNENSHNVERIFKNFGPCLVALAVNSAVDVLNLVAKHCVVGTLTGLEIGNIELSEVVAVELRPIFQQLQALKFNEVVIRFGANVFANCDSLIEFTAVVSNQNCYGPIMENYFPKLQQFTFSCLLNFIDSDEMLNFLERHKNLKSVNLNVDSLHLNTREDFFRKLGSSCKDLEELNIKNYGNNCDSPVAPTLDFSNLLSLKRLTLYCCLRDAFFSIVGLPNVKSLRVLEICVLFDTEKFLADLQFLENLRELDVKFYSIDETVQWTSLPQQLTKLSVSSFMPAAIANIVDIIRHLSNLEELIIFRVQFVLSEREFCKIVKLVEGRRNVLRLRCIFKFSQSSKMSDKYSKVKLLKWQD